MCVTACVVIHSLQCRPVAWKRRQEMPPLPGYRLPATLWVHYTTSCNTQSSAPEDGKNNCPKHVELTGIVNKPFLLHLVCCLYHLLLVMFTCIISVYSPEHL